MLQFKRLMVGIDFTLMDKTVVEYAAFLTYYLEPEKIYFVNVQPTLEVLQSLRDAFPNFEGPRDEALQKDMELVVSTYFPNYEEYNVSFDVLEGSVRKEMLHHMHVKEIDLLLVGRKKDLKGSGIVPQQLSRKSEASIMFIPEGAKPELRTIMVPTDFSEYSKLAVETAANFAAKDEDVVISLQHTYQVPNGYSKTGKTEEEFAEVMLEYNKERCDEFCKSLSPNSKYNTVFSFDRDRHSPAPEINKAAHENGADMIIIGARGRNFLTAMFLGSVTEKLIRSDNDIPIFVIKSPENKFGLGDVLEYL